MKLQQLHEAALLFKASDARRVIFNTIPEYKHAGPGALSTSVYQSDGKIKVRVHLQTGLLSPEKRKAFDTVGILSQRGNMKKIAKALAKEFDMKVVDVSSPRFDSRSRGETGYITLASKAGAIDEAVLKEGTWASPDTVAEAKKLKVNYDDWTTKPPKNMNEYHVAVLRLMDDGKARSRADMIRRATDLDPNPVSWPSGTAGWNKIDYDLYKMGYLKVVDILPGGRKVFKITPAGKKAWPQSEWADPKWDESIEELGELLLH